MPTKHKIYIIDDTPTNLQVLADYLIERGYEVFVAVDGTSAIEQITESKPDLILLDVMMPGIDGFETCRCLKSLSATKDIPVIFMTALSETIDKVRGFSVGAVDYVTKPIQHEEVLVRITTHLSLRQLQQDLEAKHSALQLAEAKYRSVFENAVIGIFQTMPDGQYVTANMALANLLGYDSPDAFIHSMNDQQHSLYLDPSRRKQFQNILIQDHNIANFESEVSRKDGTKIWISESARAVLDHSKALWGFEGFVMDITDRKHAEERNVRLQTHNQYLQQEIARDHHDDEFMTKNEGFRKILATLDQVGPTDATVLLHGETGTGKEVLARAIHDRSHRSHQPMVKVNCGAISAGLVESELFGHEKGAFTGATSKRIGRFELADGGTLFLDEVGELPLDTQVKLLRVLQEQEFERVGGSKVIHVNVRIVAATNRNLAEAIKSGSFRSDLYYRLNIFPLSVPPLRERKEDIPVLVDHFLVQFSQKLGKKLERFSEDSLEQLLVYAWPGNIRELMNVVERAAILATGPVLDIEETLELPTDGPQASSNLETLQDIERTHILKILESTNWILEGPQGAATVLGLNPSTLRFRMRKLELKRPTSSS